MTLTKQADTVYGRFMEQVRTHPDALAIADERRSLSYRELALEAARIRQALPPGASTVGIVMDHGCEQVAAALAVLSAGAAYVPAEPDFPRGRIALMMAESAVAAVLTQRPYVPVLGDLPALCLEDIPATTPKEPAPNDAEPASLA